MGKKSPRKKWLIKFRNLPTIEIPARTEGAAKVNAFKFLLQNELITHNERKSFMAHSLVGILKQQTEEVA